jgi:hypothetical protein
METLIMNDIWSEIFYRAEYFPDGLELPKRLPQSGIAERK